MEKDSVIQHELGSVVATDGNIVTADANVLEVARWSGSAYASGNGMWCGLVKVVCRNPLTNDSGSWFQQIAVKFTPDSAELVGTLPAAQVIKDDALADAGIILTFDGSNTVVSVQGLSDAVLFWGFSIFVDMMQY